MKEGDRRVCLSCEVRGDHEVCGRMLPMDANWIHVNCLLWSGNVSIHGHLIEQMPSQNVAGYLNAAAAGLTSAGSFASSTSSSSSSVLVSSSSATSTWATAKAARAPVCAWCARDKGGMLIKCSHDSCQSNDGYHFECAHRAGCRFCFDARDAIYSIYCPAHTRHADTSATFDANSMHTSLIVDVGDEAYRRRHPAPRFAIVDADDQPPAPAPPLPVLPPPPASSKRTNFAAAAATSTTTTTTTPTAAVKTTHDIGGPYLLVGSLYVEKLGEIEAACDFGDYVCPVGYTCTRLYWSTHEIGKKCLYTCRVRFAGDYATLSAYNNNNKSNVKSSLPSSLLTTHTVECNVHTIATTPTAKLVSREEEEITSTLTQPAPTAAASLLSDGAAVVDLSMMHNQQEQQQQQQQQHSDEMQEENMTIVDEQTEKELVAEEATMLR